MGKKRSAAPDSEEPSRLESGTNPLAKVDDGLDPRQHRPSADLIYESMMRGGGEPFGTPYEVGVSTLTEKIVRFFKQKGFFPFETFEPSRPKRRRNRFTRYGASRFHGAYDMRAARRAAERAGVLPKEMKKK